MRGKSRACREATQSNRSVTVEVEDLRRGGIRSGQVRDSPRSRVAEPLDWSVKYTTVRLDVDEVQISRPAVIAFAGRALSPPALNSSSIGKDACGDHLCIVYSAPSLASEPQLARQVEKEQTISEGRLLLFFPAISKSSSENRLSAIANSSIVPAYCHHA